MQDAVEALAKVPAKDVLIVDGLAYGAIETRQIDRIVAPIIALVHHPLAHENGLPPDQARRLRLLEKANLGKAAHVLVPSGHIKDVLVTDYDIASSRIEVIRPGRPEFLSVQNLARDDAAPLILSVGLLHPRKGHDVLISALDACADLTWRAVIVGAPWEKGYDKTLQNQIDAAGLGERIKLAGRVRTEELTRLYAEARIFALATRYEGYGIVFDEALINGVPIVATAAGAVPGTVPTTAGALVQPEDATGFSAALRGLLKDDVLHAKMAAAAVQAGRELPSWADAAHRVRSVIDRVRSMA
ncbi:glycosyltransferase family 4 protein [Roseovarius aestuariivivens]|uniref:glycosyltransferase family 4 protein n=1 Tax=Roseovarius aestuariivivens TaxID=1888910 RepID=UPI001FD9F386|nr:glycosyltransferase family 4 protein [Roseovarius aestuariivivens]